MRAPMASRLDFTPSNRSVIHAVSVARVFEEYILVEVARIGAAKHRVDVLIAVVVDIGEGDAVALLDMAEAAGRARVLKTATAFVAQHAVGQQRAQVGIAGADIAIEPAIVVYVSEIGPHRQDNIVEAGRFGISWNVPSPRLLYRRDGSAREGKPKYVAAISAGLVLS